MKTAPDTQNTPDTQKAAGTKEAAGKKASSRTRKVPDTTRAPDKALVTNHRPSAPPGARPAPDCTVVIFGAGGDLTARLLVPALYNLSLGRLLGPGFALIGVDRSFPDAAAWQAHLDQTMQSFTADAGAEFHPDHIDADAWARLMRKADFVNADFTRPEIFEDLATRIGTSSAIFYMAVPARFFAPIAASLGKAGLLADPEGGFRRLVVEKPFGSDLATARALNADLLEVAREDQIYRIDHFMGKEPVQSILAMRFANRIFEPIWRGEHVAEVEITAAETLGVEGRGHFYEATGALRDMVPNHLFQLLCMVAMEPPARLDADSIRSEKTRLLSCVRPLAKGDAVFGQYGEGAIDGKKMDAYRGSPDVAADSATETYVALRLAVDNWRWAGTTFLLRTGKRMAARRTEVALRFRPAPHDIFAQAGDVAEGDTGTIDEITLAVAPRQEIEIAFDVKRPGPKMVPARAVTRFAFADAFEEAPNVGYEALLYDCMIGDATLFQRADTIEEAWRIVDPALSGPARPKVEPYATGSDGPTGAARLAPDGWRPVE